MKFDITYTAKLANIPLEKNEIEKLESQLAVTLEHVNRLNSINTEDVPPTFQVTGLENVTREDGATPSLPQTQALQNAKSTHNGFIKVQAILES